MKAFTILAAVSILALPSCKIFSTNVNFLAERVEASENYITKTYTVQDFDAISCSVVCEMVYTDGATALTIEAPDNILEHIIVAVNEDGRLKIDTDGSRFVKLSKDIVLTISSPKLKAIDLNGKVDFSAPGIIKANDLDISINGAGDLEIHELEANAVGIEVNGAADSRIALVKCSKLDVEINGAGDCDISGKMGEVAVEINGAGDCTLSGEAGSSNVSINGAGDIDVSNLKTDKMKSSTNGVGKVRN